VVVEKLEHTKLDAFQYDDVLFPLVIAEVDTFKSLSDCLLKPIFNLSIKCGMVCFECENVIPLALYIWVAIAVCVPIASMVMMHPAGRVTLIAGIAVISFDLSTLDPRQDDALAHALTRCKADFPCSVVGTFEGLTINRITCAPSVSTIDCISESNAQILWG